MIFDGKERGSSPAAPLARPVAAPPAARWYPAARARLLATAALLALAAAVLTGHAALVLLAAPALGALALMPRRRRPPELDIEVARSGSRCFEGEAEMVRRRLARGSAPPVPPQVTDAGRLLAMRESLESVQLHPDLLSYVVALVAATRAHPQVTVGASPRGTLAVIQLARGHAVLDGREYVTPEDIKAVAVPALAHRLVLRPEMWVRQVTGQDVAAEILATVPVPRVPA